MSQPNILLLMTDQQRYDSLSSYGCHAAQTPHLDDLAANGALFEHCYANSPVCTPARASLMTGRSLPGHGVYRLNDQLVANHVLFPQHLQKLGYATALIGKLHVSGVKYEARQRHPHDGFDIYEWCLEGCAAMDSPHQGYRQWLEQVDPEFCRQLQTQGRALKHVPRHLHMTHWAAERTCDLLRNRDRTRPFFHMMSIFDPHNPYEDFPLEMLERIDETQISEPQIIEGELDGKPEALRREHESSYMGRFSDFSADDLRAMRRGYFASIALADLEIGRVLDCLAEEGIADNTIVIFTSDHGDMLGDHQLLAKGAFFFDPSVRVPLIFRWPDRIESGLRVEGMSQLHDLAATCLAAAGMSAKERADLLPESQNLLEAVTGGQSNLRKHAVCCYRNSGYRLGHDYWNPPIHATMICDERYKLNVYHSNQWDKPTGELYDMQADPSEIHNLWDTHQARDIRGEMSESLLEWFAGQERAWGTRE